MYLPLEKNLLIQIQCTVMRCVRHGVRVHAQKMGKSDSTGLIGHRELRVRDVQGTSKE